MFRKRTEASPEDLILGNYTATDLAKMRRQVYESDVKPALISRAAWLDHADFPDNTSGHSNSLSNILIGIERSLDRTLNQAEASQTFSPRLRLYEVGYQDYISYASPYAAECLLPGFSIANSSERQLHQAVKILMKELQSFISLKPMAVYQEVKEQLQINGKWPPPLHHEFNTSTKYTDGIEPNDNEIEIDLPTKAPHLFVSYRYNFLPVKKGGLPVFPKTVDIKATNLNNYPSARLRKFLA